jgi:phytoene synthase
MADVDVPTAVPIRRGSSSFALASALFDWQTRHRVWQLYAWCRHCDDVTDGQVLGRGAQPVRDPVSCVTELRRLSQQALIGDSSGGPPFGGLARVAAETRLPAHYIDDHLTGFEMDARGAPFETLDDTLRYCYHVAGVVGLMMAWIMGVRRRDTLLRGCDLGIAFQLTNIARDVGEDAMRGRIYLPLTWRRASGADVRPGEPLNTETCQALVPVVSRLLDEADRYYASAWHGVADLPRRSAWAVATARQVYADIGLEVRRRGAAAWEERIATPRRRKLWRLGQALWQSQGAVAAAGARLVPPRDGLWTPPDAALGH